METRWFAFFVALLASALAPHGSAADFYVDASIGSDLLGDGSESDPWQTLTFAVDQLSSSDHVVHVAPGLYDAALGELFPVVFSSRLQVRGSGPEPAVFDGGGSGMLFWITATTPSTSPASPTLEGLVLRGAESGVRVSVDSFLFQVPTLVLREVALRDMSGAGVEFLSPDLNTLLVRVIDSEFQSCRIGIDSRFVIEAQTLVKAEGCTFEDCGIGARVQAVFPTAAPAVSRIELSGCVVRDCRVGVRAEEWEATNSDVMVSLRDSLVTRCGTGLEAVNAAEIALERSTVSANQVGLGVGGVAPELASFQLANSVVWDNAALDLDPAHVTQSSYSDTPFALGGVGDLSVDPGFVDPAGGDFHLAQDSPLVEAGDPRQGPGGIDGDVDPRLLDGDLDGVARLDIGWDEHNTTALTLSGAPAIGQSIDVRTSASSGQLVCTLLGLATADLDFGSLGSLLLDPATTVLLTCGSAPASVPVALPNEPQLVGLELLFQSLAFEVAGQAGSFSNRVAAAVAGQ